MIEPYNLETNSNINLRKYDGESFFFTVIFITICIFANLIIWRVGSHIKSEKAIKFGVKNFIICIFILVFILAIPLIIAFFK